MDNTNNSDFRSFFEHALASDYYKQSVLITRKGISEIYSLSRNFSDMLKPGEKKAGYEMIDTIASVCLRMLRNAELSELLSYSAERAKVKKRVIDCEKYVTYFSDQCRILFAERKRRFPAENKHNIRVKSSQPGWIMADKYLLEFFMLSYIRRAFLVADGRRLRFLVSSERNDDNITLTLTITDFLSLEKLPERWFNDLFDEYFFEINEIFSEKLGGSFTCSNAMLTITLPVLPESDDLVVLSRDQVIRDDTFSPYSMMLRDVLNL